METYTGTDCIYIEYAFRISCSCSHSCWQNHSGNTQRMPAAQRGTGGPVGDAPLLRGGDDAADAVHAAVHHQLRLRRALHLVHLHHRVPPARHGRHGGGAVKWEGQHSPARTGVGCGSVWPLMLGGVRGAPPH